ncbi:MAG: twin-arginine translocase TatA/TatE family subunit [Actinobacteria bacterium]|nr:twin-arginine translocase TatA/TatE family subunit [Actinomycetota bacterium]
MGAIGVPELLILLVILLLIFGSKKLPQLARSIGQAGKEFKEGVKEGAVDGPNVAGPCPFCSVEIPQGAKFCPGCAKSEEEIVAERTRLQQRTA